MKKIFTLLVLMAFLPCSSLLSQRYLTEVFDAVEVSANVVYGVNATVLAYPQLGEAIPQPLVMDIYEPKNDTETERPLVLYFHTGNFLPTPENGSPTGSMRDSATVEMCTRLAKMGYVAASCDYRLGWNPLAPTQPERVYSLINAAYRGVQDSRTAARFFRMTVTEHDNPYGIDPEKIVLWGQGTGGYIAFASATINQYSDIVIPKFMHQPEGFPNPIPMVLEAVNGNLDGTNYGINPLDGDTLCYPNHVDYDSHFAMMVNMGGALGDSTWVTANDIPMVSFQSPTDPFAPYDLGTLTVPVVGLQVVEVSGSYGAQRRAHAVGLNDVFAPIEALNDEYTQKANANNDGYTGLYPFVRPTALINDSAPWEWWATDNPNSAAGLATNTTMGKTKAQTFCDTVIAYAAPRMMCALQLSGSPCLETGVNKLSDIGLTGVNIFPNPSNGQMNIVAQSEIRDIRITDMLGAEVYHAEKLNVTRYVLNRNFPSGIYLANVTTDKGISAVRLVIE